MRIAVLTSGGDAPGMNAAIRSVVRTAVARNWEAFGIKRGFEGLLDGAIIPLGARDVGGVIGTGGTILGSSRSQEFTTTVGQYRAIQVLTENDINALVIIGGSGSQKGAYALSARGFPVIGIASTIDNDLYGSDQTIGVDTALNVSIEAIDRIKITASSHHRVFAIEVMGRDCGYLALMAGIAGGAEIIILPEVKADIDDIAAELHHAYAKGKPHAIIITAEGSEYNAAALAKYFTNEKQWPGFELRTTVLGYVQRGAVPTTFDRILATRLGAAATAFIEDKKFGFLIGMINNQIASTPLEVAATTNKTLDTNLIDLASVLAK
jgi:6-phosphofructokinase 1